jgi:DNA-nicking Smr family endonuclease
MSRRRPLSDEERALWTGFTRSIKPLKNLPKREAADLQAVQLVSKKQPARPSRPQVSADVHVPRDKAKVPPPIALGRKLRQRVARGRESIDARLDLHGCTQAEAHTALLRFLHRSQMQGAKFVLVVTGKGSGKGHDQRERGVLKRQVPLWLALPEFRLLVVGFEDAHIGHGGEGALYIRLRRARGSD